MRRKKPKLFWDVGDYIGVRALKRDDCIHWMGKKDIPRTEDGNVLVLSITNTKEMAEDLETTVKNICWILNMWCEHEGIPGPFRRVGMTNEKRQGGKTIYAVGYWQDGKRIWGFSKRNIEKWLKNTLIR